MYIVYLHSPKRRATADAVRKRCLLRENKRHDLASPCSPQYHASLNKGRTRRRHVVKNDTQLASHQRGIGNVETPFHIFPSRRGGESDLSRRFLFFPESVPFIAHSPSRQLP